MNEYLCFTKFNCKYIFTMAAPLAQCLTFVWFVSSSYLFFTYMIAFGGALWLHKYVPTTFESLMLKNCNAGKGHRLFSEAFLSFQLVLMEFLGKE